MVDVLLLAREEGFVFEATKFSGTVRAGTCQVLVHGWELRKTAIRCASCSDTPISGIAVPGW